MSSVIYAFKRLQCLHLHFKVSQPTFWREGDMRAHRCVFQGRKARGVATNVYSRKTSEKPEKCGLWTLIVKGSGVIFTHWEDISTPRVRHKRRQPLIKCANMTSKLCIFPFLCFLALYETFCIFYLFVVDKGVSLAPTYSSIAMRKSDLCSSFRTKCWLSCFYLFSQDRF